MQTSCLFSSGLQCATQRGIIVVTFTDSSVAEEWVLPLFSVCYGIKWNFTYLEFTLFSSECEWDPSNFSSHSLISYCKRKS